MSGDYGPRGEGVREGWNNETAEWSDSMKVFLQRRFLGMVGGKEESPRGFSTNGDSTELRQAVRAGNAPISEIQILRDSSGNLTQIRVTIGSHNGIEVYLQDKALAIYLASTETEPQA